MPNLLLIESPGKLKKLSQILGSGWIVKASMGHIRELADEGDDALGFSLENGRIDCHYVPRDARSKKVLSELRQAVKQADRVYIATDDDREGETIGWHLQQALRLNDPARVVYREITPQAVRQAIAHPRKLNPNLVAAGRARDCLDKLVGYKGSKHIVWQLNIGAKSMGRVQSATLHLLCLREKEIQAFQPQDYWSVWVEYQDGFKAFYRAKRISERTETRTNARTRTRSAEDPSVDNAPADDTQEDKKTAPESDRVMSQADADRLVAIARSHPHQVVQVDGKIVQQAPPPPFTTSTLQQAAGAKFRFSPDKTMKVAQSLYEAGHITYMRTDSVMLSDDFCQAVRRYLEQHDAENVPQRTTRHRSSKSAQEAHEAIRPTAVDRLPDQLSGGSDERRLYELIWNRAIASQCCPARLRKTRVLTQSGDVCWEARGQVVEFPGYTRYWNNLSADTQLPVLQIHQSLTLKQAKADQKQTQPPPRYSEPKLVQLMERRGIGRPSTYAPTIKTLKDRTYVEVIKGKLHPTALGLQLDDALNQLIPDLIQPEFTAQMEASLDAIEHGQQEWQRYLIDWHHNYFAPALNQAAQQLRDRLRFNPLPKHSSLTPHPSTNTHLSSVKHSSANTHLTTKNNLEQSTDQRVNQISDHVSDRISDYICPTCGAPMIKVPSRSKKLKADHFLKCTTPNCPTVLFWNPNRKQYELPYAQRSVDPQALTEIPCPVCGAYLERYGYHKDGQDKIMLRCSIPDHRKGKCRDVAFFQVKDGFWSPTYGNLSQIQSKQPSKPSS